MTSTDTTPPERLGAYRIESLLGRGGMGEVFLAYDERLHRHVAIKRLRPDDKIGERQLERFRREARAVARLSHPAIVQIHDILDVDDGHCIVMEYVEGRRLAELVARRELDLARAVALGGEIADGLGEAHSKGLVHRDLKSENVIVTPNGRPKILDFGLALPLWRDQDDHSLTASGALVGTVRAMSPEQAEGGAVDHRADLFSLGVLLYEMVAGESPFKGGNVVDTLRRVMMEAPRPLLTVVPEVPPALSALVSELLEKDPGKRPRNAHLVASQLAELSLELGSGSAVPLASSGRYLEDAPTSSGLVSSPRPGPGSGAEDSSRPVLKTLVLVDLVDSTKMVEKLGDVQGLEVARRHDRVARDILARYEGLEIDKTDGFLLLFERPADAVAFALDYQQAVMRLSQELDVELLARTGIHLGEVYLTRNRPADVARGAKPLEVEGLAKPMAARIAALAGGRQILLSAFAFDLARRGAVDGPLADENLEWLAHGRYLFKGIDEAVEIFEVGVRGLSPLRAPADSEKARRSVAISDEVTLGWRPAVGQTIPHRPHWRLEERRGEGGFGEVWRASHESTGEMRIFKFCFEADRLRALQREVTLFRLLKEALGHRDDIARVLDWNFDAAPYFLEAEYTEGGSLVEWCEHQGGLAAVPMATRLELLAQVADALAAAHSVGVLHKDVKPENVLVKTGRDGEPRAQLTDFGISRVTDRDQLAAKGITALGFTETRKSTGSTSSGGTLRFMAPELLEGKPATIQADIYALGVMLFQSVVADFSRALSPSWRREVDDEILAEDIAYLADGTPSRRPTNAGEVARRLRSLDERRARLEAERRAAEKAEETREREERAHRRRRVAGTVAAFSLIIVSALAIQAMHARRQADRLRGQAEDLVSFMLGDLRAKLEPVGRLDVLDSVAEKALAYFASLEERDVTESSRMRHSQALHQIGEVRLAQGDLDGALETFRRALAESEELAAMDPDRAEWQIGLGNSHFWIGNLLLYRGEPEAALPEFERYLAITRRLADHEPDRTDYQLELADAHANVGNALDRLGKVDEALGHLKRDLEIKKRLVALEPERADWRFKLASSHVRAGTALSGQGDLGGALSHFSGSIDIMEGLVELDPANTEWLDRLAVAHSRASGVLVARGAPERALASRRRYLELARSLSERDPANEIWQGLVSIAHLGYGRVLAALDRRAEARRHLDAAVELYEELAARSPGNRRHLRYVANARNELAQFLLDSGDPEAAFEDAKRAVDLLAPLAEDEKADGETHLYASQSSLVLGKVLKARGDPAGARAAWEDAIEKIRPFARGTRNYVYLAPWAIAHLELGLVEEARPAVVTLVAMGYREQDFVDICRAYELPLAAPTVD